MSKLHEPAPTRGPGRTLPALLLALALPAGAAAAPALEYGPEAEARFIEHCAGDPQAPAAAPCRRLMEQLQAELGYAAFLDATANVPLALVGSGGRAPGATGRSAAPDEAGRHITLASFRQPDSSV